MLFVESSNGEPDERGSIRSAFDTLPVFVGVRPRKANEKTHLPAIGSSDSIRDSMRMTSIMGTASGGGWKPPNGPQGRQSVEPLGSLGRSLHELLLVQFQPQRQRRLPVFLEGEARHDPQLAGTSLEDVRVTQLAVLLRAMTTGLVQLRASSSENATDSSWCAGGPL